MLEHPTEFIYLTVDAFRKLTPYQKQQYVDALKLHLDLPFRAAREDQSHPLVHKHPQTPGS